MRKLMVLISTLGLFASCTSNGLLGVDSSLANNEFVLVPEAIASQYPEAQTGQLMQVVNNNLALVKFDDSDVYEVELPQNFEIQNDFETKFYDKAVRFVLKRVLKKGAKEAGKSFFDTPRACAAESYWNRPPGCYIDPCTGRAVYVAPGGVVTRK